MRGFQPHTQNYADGGVVSRIKGALGFGSKDEKTKPQAAAPAPTPVPAPTQQPNSAIGQYAAGSALKRRMAEIDGYANGGPVRGKGTGISDEVPDAVPEGTYIMPTDSTQAIGEQNLAKMGKGAPVDVQLSNGEFKMPPEQVHAIGVQALDQMKDATHTPVAARGFAPGAQQAEPPLFFVNGGVVDEEAKRKQTSPTNIFPGSHLPGDRGSTSAPERAPATAPDASPTEQSGWRTKAVMDGAADDASQLWSKGEYGQAVGTAIRGAATAVPAALVDAGEDLYSLIGKPFANVAKGVVGSTEASAAAAAPTAAKTVTPPASTAAATQPWDMDRLAPKLGGLDREFGAQQSLEKSRTMDATPARITAPATNSVTRDGNSYSGTDVAGNITINGKTPRGFVATMPAGAAPAGFGAASATNAAYGSNREGAAEALAARSQAESMGRLMASGQIQMPQAGPSMILPSGSFGFRRDPRIVAGDMAIQRGFDYARGNDPASRARAGALAQTSLQQQSENLRAGTRNNIDQQRVGIEQGRASLDASRLAIDQQRQAMDNQIRGFDVRAGERQEALYKRYAAADTQEKKAAIAQEIRDLSGKAEPANRFTVVSGGQEWDATAGAMRNVPGRVLNNQTGQFVDQAGAGQGLPPVKENPAAMAIVNNQQLSLEQRKAELQKLGYN